MHRGYLWRLVYVVDYPSHLHYLTSAELSFPVCRGVHIEERGLSNVNEAPHDLHGALQI